MLRTFIGSIVKKNPELAYIILMIVALCILYFEDGKFDELGNDDASATTVKKKNHW